MHGCSGGMRGCSGGHAWLLGGHAWLLWGGMHGCLGACVIPGGGVHGFFHEIQSMSGQYASYWNVFLLLDKWVTSLVVIMQRNENFGCVHTDSTST